MSAAAAWAALTAAGCHSGGNNPPPPMAATRTWRMGFSALPPRPDPAEALTTIAAWSSRADLALIHDEPPWAVMLSGASLDNWLQQNRTALVDIYRSKGMQVVYMTDLTNGLNRSQEAPNLVAIGHSLAEPAVQQAVRNYVLAVSRLLRPDYLGLAAETNLIRIQAPSIYASVRQTANAAAADVATAGTPAKLFVSVQVETAWGFASGGPFIGIDTDRADFSFMQLIGLSSYPYLVYPNPEDPPSDYYSRLLSATAPLPMMVVEGGWPSVSVPAMGIVTSPEKQVRYVTRQAALLDGVSAIGWTQLQFTDLDPVVFAAAGPFLTIGLVDTQYVAKPALAQWDALFARPRA
ncbi:MAG TPA: hypothetical protein VFU71_07165 [Burkholderiaceae bacterium]|nr:hypothetical protein [Burkholderiaceae bacterium]